MARMHDKYLVVDDLAYILGGRNTFGYFLGDYEGHKNYDRDVLVFNTGGEESGSSLYQVEAYFDEITTQECCSVFHDSAYIANKTSVIRAREDLEERYQKLCKKSPELFEQGFDYTEITYPTNSIQLITNPTNVYCKEPTAFYELAALMLDADENVAIHTPYIMADENMNEIFGQIANQVDITIMHNSVANNGNPFAAGDYYYQKENIMSTGMTLLEYDGGVSYHGKSIAIDDDMAIVGSFNMDMRSVYIDTELMLAIQSEDLNDMLRDSMQEYEQQAGKVLTIDTYSLPDGLQMQQLTEAKRRKLTLLHYVVGWARFLL